MNSEQIVSNLSEGEQQHELLMQLEAIIFASDSAVSLARLKEAFKINIAKRNYASFYNNWPCYNMVARLN